MMTVARRYSFPSGLSYFLTTMMMLLLVLFSSFTEEKALVLSGTYILGYAFAHIYLVFPLFSFHISRCVMSLFGTYGIISMILRNKPLLLIGSRSLIVLAICGIILCLYAKIALYLRSLRLK